MGDFDTEFNYGPVGNLIADTIVFINGRIAENNVHISDLESISGYGNVSAQIASDILLYQQTNAWLTTEKNAITAIQPQIAAVEALGASEKQLLYDYSLIAAEPKIRYMARMLTHHDAMIVDADINALVVDGNISANAAASVALYICQSYPLDGFTYEYTRISEIL